MKKGLCMVLIGVTLLLATPLLSYAGGSRVYVGGGVRVGHPGWGHPVRGAYWYGGGYRGYWGPRPWGGWGYRPYWGAGVFIAPPFFYGPPPAYYAPPPVIVEQAPPAYVPAPQPPQQYYWYYCQDSQAYYPYVKECPKGWMKVAPQPQPPDH